MTDDEVKQWLGPADALLWKHCEPRNEEIDPPREEWACDVEGMARDALRRLAETRKALAASMHRHDVHDEGPTDHCPICGHVHRNHSIIPVSAHEPTCVFATMPRPR